MRGTTINVRLEHKPALWMCSLVFDSDPETRSSIVIQESAIALYGIETECCINLKLGDGYSIDLTSLHKWNTVKWEQAESIQGLVRAVISSSETIHLKLASQPEDRTPKRSVEVLPANIRYGLHCKRCDLPLTNENWEPKRVLPLPSENWQSSQDMWFCHKHDEPPSCEDQESSSSDPSRAETAGSPGAESLNMDCESKLLTRELLPRNEDLFYSNTKFLVHSNAMSSNSMAYAGFSSIICRGCQNIVGKRDTEESTYYYRMNVDLQDTNTSRVINPRTPLNLLAQLVREEITHGCAPCRLILKSESSGDALLIWVLVSDVLVFSEELSIAQSEEIEKKIAFDQCHQVLFQCSKRFTPIVQAWSAELTVRTESILQSTLDALREHLLLSRKMFAKCGSDDSFDPSFEIGCIPAL